MRQLVRDIESIVYDDTNVNNGYYVMENGRRKYFWSREEASMYLDGKANQKQENTNFGGLG